MNACFHKLYKYLPKRFVSQQYYLFLHLLKKNNASDFWNSIECKIKIINILIGTISILTSKYIGILDIRVK